MRIGTMRHHLAAAMMVIAMGLAGSTTVAGAQQPAAAKPQTGGVASADIVKWKGVVLAIDYMTRNVTLQTLTGTFKNVTLSKADTNLMKIKQGDTVSVEAVAALAVYMRKASEPPVGSAASMMSVAPKGRAVIDNVQVKEVNAVVTAINDNMRIIQVVESTGDTLTFRADTSMHNLSAVKPGDHVVLRFTEAIIVALTH